MKKFKLMEDDSKKRGDTGIIIDDGTLIDVGMDVENLVIPDGVIDIEEEACHSHPNLKSITFPDSVVVIKRGAFVNCAGLTEINFGKGLRTIEANAFNRCPGLSTLTIPNSVKSIDEYAFWHCSNLSNVSLGKGIEFIGPEAFTHTNLEQLNYAGTPEEWCLIKQCSPISPYDQHHLLYANGKKVTEFAPTNGLTTIRSGAFFMCESLESVILPDSVTSIGMNAFSHCAQLKTVKLGNGIQSLRPHTFHSCTNLKSIHIPSSIIHIDIGTFAFCERLTTIIYDGTISQWSGVKIAVSWTAPANTAHIIKIHCTNGDLSIISG